MRLSWLFQTNPLLPAFAARSLVATEDYDVVNLGVVVDLGGGNEVVQNTLETRFPAAERPEDRTELSILLTESSHMAFELW